MSWRSFAIGTCMGAGYGGSTFTSWRLPLRNGLQLWTADPSFAALADELRIAYDVSGSDPDEV